MQWSNQNNDEFYQVQLYQGGKNLCPVVFADEHFKPHPKYPRYLVSTYGRVYDTKLKRMKIPRMRKNSYVSYQTCIAPKHFSNLFAHRLVMETFDPISNSDEMVVNHKDLNKWNNKIDNLEWVTQRENILHAFDNGAMPSGEEAAKAKHTNEEVNKVCTLLEKGFNYKDICKTMGYEINNKNLSFLSTIKNHEAWTRISKNYNF